VELTVFHFGRVTGRPAKLGALAISPVELAEGRQRFSQRIVGDGDFTIAVDLPPEFVRLVAQGMLGIDIKAGSETETDAVCEFLNLIGGNACTRIEQLGLLLRPEPPICSGSGNLVTPSEQAVFATVVSGDDDFDIRVFSAPGEAA
jgi:CheY-specific phosphatase CheX